MKKQKFGVRSLVLLPAEKLGMLSPRGVRFIEEFHEFLLDKFNGYTRSHGGILGAWKEEEGRIICGEYIEYRVACSNEMAIPEFEAYLSSLARELDEECIFWEHGGEAFLIYP